MDIFVMLYEGLTRALKLHKDYTQQCFYFESPAKLARAATRVLHLATAEVSRSPGPGEQPGVGAGILSMCR